MAYKPVIIVIKLDSKSLGILSPPKLIQRITPCLSRIAFKISMCTVVHINIITLGMH